MFLTDEQLVILTGRKRRAGQIAWLAERRIPHIVSAAGFPVVAVREVERRLVQDPKIQNQGPAAVGWCGECSARAQSLSGYWPAR